jgi:hypothetical protein
MNINREILEVITVQRWRPIKNLKLNHSIIEIPYHLAMRTSANNSEVWLKESYKSHSMKKLPNTTQAKRSRTLMEIKASNTYRWTKH